MVYEKGQKYQVVVAETKDGQIKIEEMIFVKEIEHDGKTLFVFLDCKMFEETVRYDHGQKIDWKYLDLINELYESGKI